MDFKWRFSNDEVDDVNGWNGETVDEASQGYGDRRPKEAKGRPKPSVDLPISRAGEGPMNHCQNGWKFEKEWTKPEWEDTKRSTKKPAKSVTAGEYSVPYFPPPSSTSDETRCCAAPLLTHYASFNIRPWLLNTPPRRETEPITIARIPPSTSLPPVQPVEAASIPSGLGACVNKRHRFPQLRLPPKDAAADGKE